MIERPESLSIRTDRALTVSTDTLSDVLGAIRLSGAVLFDVQGSAPWVAEAPPVTQVAALVMPDVEHAIEYHVMVDGDAWASLIGEPDGPVRLTAGSVILFPHGDAHVLASAPGMRAEPDTSFLERFRERGGPVTIRKGGGSEVRFICGLIGFDIKPFNPLLNALPRMIHIRDGYSARGGWLRHLISATADESKRERIGRRSTLSRLSELLFIEAIRSHLEFMPADARGWLAALEDHRIQTALLALHRYPERRWTLHQLAREAGVSRTLLTKLFTERLGVAPMTYLTNWRMSVAANMLTERETTISRVASQVGYGSEASFSKAFKRATGMTPGSWRSRNR